MWSRFQFIFNWLRELYSRNPDEFNLKSRKFNTRKFVFLLITVGSLALNAFLLNRVVYLVKRVQTLENNIQNYNVPYRHNFPIIPYRVP